MARQAPREARLWPLLQGGTGAELQQDRSEGSRRLQAQAPLREERGDDEGDVEGAEPQGRSRPSAEVLGEGRAAEGHLLGRQRARGSNDARAAAPCERNQEDDAGARERE